jgi:hypothetical protein
LADFVVKVADEDDQDWQSRFLEEAPCSTPPPAPVGAAAVMLRN